jgi:Protein of unknown function (DUF2905)
LQTRLFFYMVVVGLLWPWLSKLGLGRLADDIAIERGNVTFYFPIVPDRERSAANFRSSGSVISAKASG